MFGAPHAKRLAPPLITFSHDSHDNVSDIQGLETGRASRSCLDLGDFPPNSHREVVARIIA